MGKAKCDACHSGPNFTDEGFHNIGLNGNTDEGRYVKKPVRVLKGAFKTPTLRDIALTAPYMHNGAYRTLEDVVNHYNRADDLRETLASLARLRPTRNWEVIVVDNNSSDGTRDVVHEAAAVFPAPLRYLVESEQGRSPALNAGIRALR